MVTGVPAFFRSEPLFPPTIDSVLLSEVSPGNGVRFDGERFALSITLSPEGKPISKKGIKAYIDGDFSEPLFTDEAQSRSILAQPYPSFVTAIDENKSPFDGSNGTENYVDVAVNLEKFCAITDTNVVATSQDGFIWQKHTLNLTGASTNASFSRIVALRPSIARDEDREGPGAFFALGSDDTGSFVARSTDGINFTLEYRLSGAPVAFSVGRAPAAESTFNNTAVYACIGNQVYGRPRLSCTANRAFPDGSREWNGWKLVYQDTNPVYMFTAAPNTYNLCISGNALRVILPNDFEELVSERLTLSGDVPSGGLDLANGYLFYGNDGHYIGSESGSNLVLTRLESSRTVFAGRGTPGSSTGLDGYFYQVNPSGVSSHFYETFTGVTSYNPVSPIAQIPTPRSAATAGFLGLGAGRGVVVGDGGRIAYWSAITFSLVFDSDLNFSLIAPYDTIYAEGSSTPLTVAAIDSAANTLDIVGLNPSMTYNNVRFLLDAGTAITTGVRRYLDLDIFDGSYILAKAALLSSDPGFVTNNSTSLPSSIDFSASAIYRLPTGNATFDDVVQPGALLTVEVEAVNVVGSDSAASTPIEPS